MDNILSKASQPSIVEQFTIYGLYGHRTVGIDTPNSAAVIIARNGAGKQLFLAC